MFTVFAFAWASSAASSCSNTTFWMARLNYSNTTLDVCEDLHSGLNGSIEFRVAPRAPALAGFPLTLHKRTASNQPIGGNDTQYGPYTKDEVLGATTDLLGNTLLGIHGHPPRSAEPTLAEVAACIPPIRGIKSARVWTAARSSGVDATLDEAGSTAWHSIA